MRAPKFWNARELSGRALATALSPFGVLYGLSVRIKQRGARPFRPKARVICVGNLTAGGSGKTPLAIALGQILAGHGRRVVFLTRGYGGRNAGPLKIEVDTHTAGEVGDEPLLLASVATTVVARDRAKGAALADELNAEIIVMDDGFQNFSIEKDLSLVVVDAETGFGNGRLIPAGPLRENPSTGLARADAVVFMNGEADIPEFDGETLRARIELAGCPSLQGKKLFAFAGIGRPEKFFGSLREMGASVVGRHSFPDHHNFSADDIERLKTRADALNAFLVTTEKDFVRLDAEAREGVFPVPVRAVLDDAVAWSRLLGRLV